MVATMVRSIPDSDLNALVAFERDLWYPNAALLKDYRKYVLGDQIDPRTTSQKNMFPELETHSFCDNVCRRVVTIPANRLSIARFDVDDPAVAEFIAQTELLNQFSVLAASVNIATLRDGDHAVVLRWANGAVRFIREAWWNGEDGIFVAYDDNDLPKYAVKEWGEVEGTTIVLRRTIWLPDQIQRHRSTDGGQSWELFNLPGDAVQGGRPIPFTATRFIGQTGEMDDPPIGLPVVHFAARLVPNDGPGGSAGGRADSRYGVSLLSGGALGIQDRINLIHFDIVSTSSFTGTQMLWAAGVTIPRDPVTQKPVPYEVVPGAVLTDSNDNARFGAFPAGNVDAHDRALAIQKETLAQMTGLPYVVLAGNWPSGEALARAESDLAEMVDKFGEGQGPAFASLMHKATLLANGIAATNLDTTAPIRTVFQNAQRLNPLAVAAQLVQLAEVEGKREALRDIGKQPDDIDRIMQELQDEGTANADALEREMNRQLSGAAASARRDAGGGGTGEGQAANPAANGQQGA